MSATCAIAIHYSTNRMGKFYENLKYYVIYCILLHDIIINLIIWRILWYVANPMSSGWAINFILQAL